MMAPIFRKEVYTDQELINYIRAHNDEAFRYLYLESVPLVQSLSGDSWKAHLKSGLIRFWKEVSRTTFSLAPGQTILSLFQAGLKANSSVSELEESRALNRHFRSLEEQEQQVLIFEYYDRRGLQNTANLLYASADEIRNQKMKGLAKWSKALKGKDHKFTQHFPDLNSFEAAQNAWSDAQEDPKDASSSLSIFKELTQDVQQVGLFRALESIEIQIDDFLKRPKQPKLSIPLLFGALAAVFLIAFTLRSFLPPKNEVLAKRYLKPYPALQIPDYPESIQEAMKAYQQKDFEQAFEDFDQLQQANDTSELVRFYRIQSLMKVGKFQEAKAAWARFSSGESHRKHTKDWHLAMIDLHEGKIDQAKMQFKAMENNSTHYYNRMATTLIRKIDQLL